MTQPTDRGPLWSVTTAQVLTSDCPTCGAASRRPCVTLRDRIMATLHRGRTTRYLNVRFGLDNPERPRSAPAFVPTPASADRTPHLAYIPDGQRPRMSLEQIEDLISVNFHDLVRVVTDEALGMEQPGLLDLLYGPDRISDSIDALVYAAHDLQLRWEIQFFGARHAARAQEISRRLHAVRRRVKEAEAELKRQRTADLSTGGVRPAGPPNRDPDQVARRWLGRFLASEREARVTTRARELGVPDAAALPLRSVHDKITRAIERGLLTAPVTESVRAVQATDDTAFGDLVLRDARLHNGRDDVLAHPLLLDRWTTELQRLREAAAPAACNPSSERLSELPDTARGPSRLAAINTERRRFAALVQRSREAARLRDTLNDAVTVAEVEDPYRASMAIAHRRAADDLVAAHPSVYALIRVRLAAHERDGQLVRMNPAARQDLKRTVFAELASLPNPGRVHHH